MEPEVEISFAWRRWAAISLLNGTSLAKTIEVMSGSGIPESQAAQVCAEILTDPAFEAGKWSVGRTTRLEGVLERLAQLRALDPCSSDVDRRADLSREEFLHAYYSRNDPVMLQDACADWPALEKWSPEYLAKTLGDLPVGVGTNPDASQPATRPNAEGSLRFEDFARQATEAESHNSLHLVDDGNILAAVSAAPLLNDFQLDSRYLSNDRRQASLSFESTGSVTGLRRATRNQLLHQLVGSSHVVLISPLYTHFLGNPPVDISGLNPFKPDGERFPNWARIAQLEITTEVGDALFIPVGWWHHITALEVSIGLWCSEFVFPNTFDQVAPSTQ